MAASAPHATGPSAPRGEGPSICLSPLPDGVSYDADHARELAALMGLLSCVPVNRRDEFELNARAFLRPVNQGGSQDEALRHLLSVLCETDTAAAATAAGSTSGAVSRRTMGRTTNNKTSKKIDPTTPALTITW